MSRKCQVPVLPVLPNITVKIVILSLLSLFCEFNKRTRCGAPSPLPFERVNFCGPCAPAAVKAPL